MTTNIHNCIQNKCCLALTLSHTLCIATDEGLHGRNILHSLRVHSCASMLNNINFALNLWAQQDWIYILYTTAVDIIKCGARVGSPKSLTTLFSKLFSVCMTCWNTSLLPDTFLPESWSINFSSASSPDLESCALDSIKRDNFTFCPVRVRKILPFSMHELSKEDPPLASGCTPRCG